MLCALTVVTNIMEIMYPNSNAVDLNKRKLFTPKQKYRYFDESIVTGCTPSLSTSGAASDENFVKNHNYEISISVYWWFSARLQYLHC